MADNVVYLKPDPDHLREIKMTLETVAILLVFPLIFTGNILFTYVFIKKAIRSFVIADLKNKGYLFVNYKWTGLFNHGDFENKQDFFAFFKTSLNSISIFSYIYYKDSEETKRMTIKIKVVDLSIDTVVYSRVI